MTTFTTIQSTYQKRHWELQHQCNELKQKLWKSVPLHTTKQRKTNSKICLHWLRIKSNYKKNLCYVHKVYTQVRSLLLISLSHIRLTGLKRFDLCWIASRRHATWHYSRHQQQSNTRDGDIRDVGNRFIYAAWW
jgi:hypothetical protein